METFTEVLKYSIPGVLVAALVIYLVHKFIAEAQNQRKADQLLKNHEITIPLRLQAYERIVLFLERISIDSLLVRHSPQGLKSRQLHTELLASIRNEYEHNISQQVYISPKAWEMVKNARAQIVKVINTAAEQTDSAAPGIELSKKIIEGIGEFPKSPTQTAIDFVKNEVQALF